MQGSDLSPGLVPGMDATGPTPAEDALRAYARAAINDAKQYVDDEIGPKRAKATKYYFGEKFGNEEPGRSQVVLTDVRDTVQAILPSLMRIFFGSERVVEFVPKGPEDVDAAEQATDYVNHIITKDNPGFEIIYAAFKDALVRKTGIIKWWWDESVSVQTHKFSGLTEEAVAALLQEADVEVVEHSQEMAAEGQPTHSLTVRRTKRKGRPCIAAVPPEEFLINRKARSKDDSLIVVHRTDKTRSDLIAMGYDAAELDGLSFRSDLFLSEERQARNKGVDFKDSTEDHEANNVITYYECWLRFDMDGDGIAELMRVCMASDRLLHHESVDEVPFAVFCPDPEPHTFFGLSMADYTMDLQLIKSVVVRNVLDSLAQSIHPRTAVVDTQVNMQDLLNNEVGGIVRMRQPGMVQPLAQPFIGQQAFPLIQYLDEIRESRTGMSKASMGLDADALQSTTRAAVTATVSAAQQHIELIARIFAETGFKDLCTGLLKLVTRHQDQARMVRLRNEWVPIDPRSWDTDMDVAINVALGYGTADERIQTLMAIAAKQEQVMQTAGFDNPLVDPFNLHHTYTKILELSGWKDTHKFFNDPSEYEPPEPKPDPTEMMMQVQMEDIRAGMAVKAAQLELEKQKIALEQDFKRDELDADILLRKRDMELKYKTQVDVAELRASNAGLRPEAAEVAAA
jgi:hypothetical protein